MRILLIDDDPNDRTLVAREIRRDFRQAEILEIEGPDELAAALAADGVDLAVLDYSLGWSNGLSVFRKVKAVDPDCSAIMYTGTLGEEHAVEAIKAGLDDYIIKHPSRVPRLRAAIHALLERREQRQALRRAEARYRDLFAKVTVGLFACAPDGAFEDGNPALLAMLGLDGPDELRRLTMFDLLASDEIRERWRRLPAGGINNIESRLRRPDGRTLWVLVNAYPASGRTGAVEGVLTDVTALKTAVEEKTVLLREIQHRVHNNLQLVTALLRFQERRFPESEASAAFREVEERVHALALIQQRLYEHQDYSAVDFAGYLRDLTAALLPPERPPVRVTLELAPLSLPIDKAIPLGLLANELLTDALQHGVPAGPEGEPHVTLRPEPDGWAALVVASPEGGRPHGAELGDGLGARLIHNLAAQAEATIDITRNGGFTVEVRFRHAEG